MTYVSVILEGDMVRAVYLDGRLADFDLFDFDLLEDRDEEDIRYLLDRIDDSPRGSKLRTDLLTWRGDVVAALDGFHDREEADR